MRVLILNYEYPPLGAGAGVMTKSLAGELANHVDEIVVITTWYEGLQQYEEEKNIRIYRVRSIRKNYYQSNPIEMLSWAMYAMKLIRSNIIFTKEDVVLANFVLPGGIVGYWIKKRYKIPYFVISHGHDIPWFSRRQMFFYHLLLYPVLWFLAKNASGLVHLTNSLKLRGQKFVRTNNVVIPNGIDRDWIYKERSVNSEYLELLFVGRLVGQKNPMTVLKAVEFLKRYNLPVRLTVLGDGDLRAKMQDYIIKNEMNNVYLLGKQTSVEVRRYMQLSHILLLPSIDEAMSMTLLEAIASKLYVIATKSADNEGLIATYQCGEYIQAEDYIEIAEKIKQFYSSGLYKKPCIKEQNYLQFVEKYAWQTIAKKYLAILSKPDKVF